MICQPYKNCSQGLAQYPVCPSAVVDRRLIAMQIPVQVKVAPTEGVRFSLRAGPSRCVRNTQVDQNRGGWVNVEGACYPRRKPWNRKRYISITLCTTECSFYFQWFIDMLDLEEWKGVGVEWGGMGRGVYSYVRDFRFEIKC